MCFYRAAAAGLRGLERRLGRACRFGDNARATWKHFAVGSRAELKDEDRLDLLVREAAVTNPDGFAPRVIFAIPALADDEPFGPDWESCPRLVAQLLLREADKSAEYGGDPLALLDVAAAAWGRGTQRVASMVQHIDPTSRTRFLVAGTDAIRALASQFAGKPELDLSSQVTLVASGPAVRQLFGLAIALVGSVGKQGRAQSRSLEDATPLERVDQVLVGDDATVEDRAAVDRLTAASPR